MADVRLFVVDDHPVVREGVAMLVSGEPSMSIVGYAPNGNEAIADIKRVRPDVVLLDLRLPDMLAPEIVLQIKRDLPEVRVIVFTAYADHAALQAVRRAGAEGCLLKDVAPVDFVDAIRRVTAGETVYDNRIAGNGGDAQIGKSNISLTPREYDVLRRAAMGESNPEIGEALDLSRNTVKTYLQSAMQKLNARNRVEAISRANELGLL